jgi:hypothetical protein
MSLAQETLHGRLERAKTGLNNIITKAVDIFASVDPNADIEPDYLKAKDEAEKHAQTMRNSKAVQLNRFRVGTVRSGNVEIHYDSEGSIGGRVLD